MIVMYYLEIVKYFLLIFSSLVLGNYIVLRKTEIIRIILSTIALFLYSLYLYSFLYYFFPFVPWSIKDAIVWIAVSMVINKKEGLKYGALIGISSFIIFFIIRLLI